MRSRTYPTHVLALSALLALAACGPTPLATVAFTSHADGAVILGDRTLTLSADLSHVSHGATITVSGDALIHGMERSGDVLELDVTLKDNANTITVTVAGPGEPAPATATILLHYPFVTLGRQQAASTVIGQRGFDATDEAADDKRFLAPRGRPVVADGVLYLPDYGAGRVMGYLQVPTANDAAADFVLGKAAFEDTGSTIGPAAFSGPQTLESDGQRLFSLDYHWNRILVYEEAPATSGAAATHVIGQAGFTSSDGGATATRFDSVEGFTIGGDRLIVADSGNNRVLIWNSVPTEVDTPADLVLGQADMGSNAANGGGSVGPSGLHYPSDVWSDGTRLVVVDMSNHRVLVWNSFPTVNDAPADVVLGQVDFTSNGAGQTASGLNGPYGVHSNGNQLFVADASNNRVLVWNGFPTENGQAADVVLGQPDFDGWSPSTSVTGLRFPTSVYGHGNQLFVGDLGNQRYVLFEGADP